MAKKKAAPVIQTVTMEMPDERKNPLDLELGIKDFGPISSGKVKLKPLTVLIGPNNSGKTYSAILAFSLMKCLNPSRWATRTNPSNFIREIIYGSRSIGNKLRSLKSGETISFPSEFTEEIYAKITNKHLAEELNNTLPYLFTSKSNDLVSHGKNQFSISVKGAVSFEAAVSQGAFELSNVVFKNKSSEIIIAKYGDKNRGVLETSTGSGMTYDERIMSFDEAVVSLVFSTYKNRFGEQIFTSYFLPSARDSLLQMMNSYMRSSIESHAGQFSDNGHEQNAPLFSGVIANFFIPIISLSPQNTAKNTGHFFDLATDLENELLHGRIELMFSPVNIPEAVFVEQNNIIPLHRASSTVNEIAPIIIYLKYIVKPGDFLTIEEPEAHLHPANQRILAKYLVRLIRQGLNILITTHSDFLLEQFNNFILASKIDDKARTKKTLGLGKDDYLNADEVGAYVFKKNKRGGGFKIEQVETTDEDGISEDEFMKCTEALYEEMIKIRRAGEEKKNPDRKE